MNEKKGFVRESAGWRFLSVGAESEEHLAPKKYVWTRIRKNGDTLILWVPEAGKFAQLVKDGLLPGKTDSGNVHLGELDSQHYELIASEEQGMLFYWDVPIILRRVGE